jgi:hypothetical protein
VRESEEVGVDGVGVETVGVVVVVGVVLMEPVAPEAGGVFVIVEGGGEGGVVVTTGALWVEPLAPVDCAEAFPAASYAETV